MRAEPDSWAALPDRVSFFGTQSPIDLFCRRQLLGQQCSGSVRTLVEYSELQ